MTMSTKRGLESIKEGSAKMCFITKMKLVINAKAKDEKVDLIVMHTAGKPNKQYVSCRD